MSDGASAPKAFLLQVMRHLREIQPQEEATESPGLEGCRREGTQAQALAHSRFSAQSPKEGLRLED